MNNNDQNFMVEKIRTQYVKKESSTLDALLKLDKRVKRPADVLAYVTGSVGALIAGSGMSLTMTEIGTTLGLASVMLPGIVIGVVGLAITALNYPIYKRFLAARREKFADEVLRLSEEIAQEVQD